MSTETDAECETTRITRKGQVIIPKELRDEFGLEESDEVVWQTGDDGIVVRKATRASARGMLIPDDTSSEKREEVTEELERRVHEHRESIEEDLVNEDA